MTALGHRSFRRLVAARTTTTLGNAIAPLALAFAVLDQTGSAADLGLVVGARSATNVIFLLLGGVLADRLPRQRLLVWASVAAGISQATVAALVLTSNTNIPALLALSAFNGAVSALSLPASSAVTPLTVPAEARQQANALLRLGTNSAQIAGAALGGVLVATAGPGYGLAVDAMSFFLAAIWFAALRLPAAGPQREKKPGLLSDLREGWGEFTAHSWVWLVVLAFILINAAFVGGLQVLGPVVANGTIGRAGWGLVLATETAGMLIGGLVVVRVRLRRPVLSGLLAATSTTAALLATLALYPALPLLLAVGLLSGVGTELFIVGWDTSLQEHIPAEKLARVYSYDMLGSLIAVPIGQVVIGPVAGLAGTSATLLGAAFVVLGSALIVAAPSVRALSTAPSNPEKHLDDAAAGWSAVDD